MVCALNHHSSVTIYGTDNSTARMCESGKQGAELGVILQTNSTDASLTIMSHPIPVLSGFTGMGALLDPQGIKTGLIELKVETATSSFPILKPQISSQKEFMV